MAIKKNDFIEIDYIGRIKGTNMVFDLTSEEAAKKANIHNPKIPYKPRVICVGNGDVVKSLDESFIGKETGKDYKIELHNPFGEKNPSMVKVVPSTKFTNERIRPFPGLQINADGMLATIRSVAGGRVTLDFNHPLAGKDVVYDIKVNKIVNDNSIKLKSMVENLLGEAEDHFKVEEKDDIFNIKLKHDINKVLKDKFIEKAKELIFNIKLEFIVEEKNIKE